MSLSQSRPFSDINLNQLFSGSTSLASASSSIPSSIQSSVGNAVIGIDYIPNMNAQLTIIASFQPDSEHNTKLASAGIDPSIHLPANFNWADENSVRASGRMPDFESKWIMKPPNQSHCGSCWAVSSASVLTDRISIAEKSKIPNLSATTVASCAAHTQGQDGCSGGFPSDAGCFSSRSGYPRTTVIRTPRGVHPMHSRVNCHSAVVEVTII